MIYHYICALFYKDIPLHKNRDAEVIYIDIEGEYYGDYNNR